MRYCVGIDLGSTTTKAVVLSDEGAILGRGITNSRSNYQVACQVALGEALNTARFGLVAAELGRRGVERERQTEELATLERHFRKHQYLGQLEALHEAIEAHLPEGGEGGLRRTVEQVLELMVEETPSLFAVGARRRSDFFRDLAGSRYLRLAETFAKQNEVSYDRVVGLFDKAILEVENLPPGAERFLELAGAALADFDSDARETEDATEDGARRNDSLETLSQAVGAAGKTSLDLALSVGTGYGRATLPFPKERIRSEILCHGLGAHAMFPGTRTVLDIGGQDTKAIQVDAKGIVTSFQMNDRCAAGCGRYLGYIADEMNVGVHELGPMASQATRTVKINSTCTVFAGAELRERLSLGEKREDILSGLHRAVILRAMSLLARSGGIEDQFTFTGGVANNEAAVAALEQLTEENYGDVELNISPDSIYTGALGAALFAHRAWLREGEEEALQ
jgi:benzoyl-CoA reductase subunit A